METARRSNQGHGEVWCGSRLYCPVVPNCIVLNSNIAVTKYRWTPKVFKFLREQHIDTRHLCTLASIGYT